MKLWMESSPGRPGQESLPTGQPLVAVLWTGVSATKSPPPFFLESHESPWNVCSRPNQCPTSCVAVWPRLKPCELPPGTVECRIVQPSWRKVLDPALGGPAGSQQYPSAPPPPPDPVPDPP